MKKNKVKTVVQQKNRYKAIQYSCFAGEFVSAAIPFVAIGIANYDKYFVQYNGTKMSISFFMALAVMGFAIWSITKKKMQNSFVTLLIGWATCAFIFQMMGSMITDLSTIMWFGLAGLVGSYGLDVASQSARKKKEKLIEGIEKAKLENTAKQYAKEELDDIGGVL